MRDAKIHRQRKGREMVRK